MISKSGATNHIFSLIGILLWSIPFILGWVFKYVNIKYAIALFIAGTLFFIRYAYETWKEKMEEKNEQ